MIPPSSRSARLPLAQMPATKAPTDNYRPRGNAGPLTSFFWLSCRGTFSWTLWPHCPNSVCSCQRFLPNRRHTWRWFRRAKSSWHSSTMEIRGSRPPRSGRYSRLKVPCLLTHGWRAVKGLPLEHERQATRAFPVRPPRCRRPGQETGASVVRRRVLRFDLAPVGERSIHGQHDRDAGHPDEQVDDAEPWMRCGSRVVAGCWLHGRAALIRR